MTLLTGVVVTVVVWAVSLVRSVSLRALIYSLPLPITVVLVTTPIRVGPEHLVGVLLLVAFVATVAWLHQRLRWHILLADLAGVAVYVAGSWALVRAGQLPFVPVLAVSVGLWALLALLVWRTARPSTPPPPGAVPERRRLLPTLGRLAVLASGALLMVALGQLLHGMVVTFPYAGILVVIETRHRLVEFWTHFVRNSIGLLAFMTAYYATQDHGRAVALAAAWAAFLCCTVVVRLAVARLSRTTEASRP
jgi:hypothetical protein